MPLDHAFFLNHKDTIEQLLEFCPWDRPALEEDLLEALQLTVPVGCSRPLIRLGGDGDGAYLLPDHLDGIDACFSPGVADRIQLEQELAQERWLGSHDNESSLSLDASVLAASDSVLAKFRIVVIEFHFLARLASARFLNHRFLPVLRKLQRHFDCVHAHANNCCGTTQLCGIEVPNVLEFSLYRRGLNQPPLHPPCLPHPLDVINGSSKPPLLLAFLIPVPLPRPRPAPRPDRAAWAQVLAGFQQRGVSVVGNHPRCTEPDLDGLSVRGRAEVVVCPRGEPSTTLRHEGWHLVQSLCLRERPWLAAQQIERLLSRDDRRELQALDQACAGRLPCGEAEGSRKTPA